MNTVKIQLGNNTFGHMCPSESTEKIMQAFGILVSELSRPQLRPNTRDNMIGLPNIPIDAATLRNFVSNKSSNKDGARNKGMNTINKSRDRGSNKSSSRKNKASSSPASSLTFSATPSRKQMTSRIDEVMNKDIMSPNSNLPPKSRALHPTA